MGSMTTETHHRTPPTATTRRTTRHASDRSGPLRTALRINAVVSVVSGSAMALFAGAVADVLDVSTTGWLRLIGAGVVLFGADVAWLSTRPTHQLCTLAPAVIAADALWVAVSTATILAGWYSSRGDLAVAGMAAVIAAVATAQFAGWRRIR